jgi:hypothetical protein
MITSCTLNTIVQYLRSGFEMLSFCGLLCLLELPDGSWRMGDV